MDLQGAEIEALKGAGDLLKNVKYIITEGCVQPFYQGAPHIDEITTLLEEYGFNEVYNLEGGIDDWSVEIDNELKRYLRKNIYMSGWESYYQN